MAHLIADQLHGAEGDDCAQKPVSVGAACRGHAPSVSLTHRCILSASGCHDSKRIEVGKAAGVREKAVLSPSQGRARMRRLAEKTSTCIFGDIKECTLISCWAHLIEGLRFSHLGADDAKPEEPGLAKGYMQYNQYNLAAVKLLMSESRLAAAVLNALMQSPDHLD